MKYLLTGTKLNDGVCCSSFNVSVATKGNMSLINKIERPLRTGVLSVDAVSRCTCFVRCENELQQSCVLPNSSLSGQTITSRTRKLGEPQTTRCWAGKGNFLYQELFGGSHRGVASKQFRFPCGKGPQ